MSHLSIERLAALADEQPSAAEAEHLRSCDRCRLEHEAYLALAAAAKDERGRISPPITRWETLSSELRVAGLIRGADPGSRLRRWGLQHGWMRGAAAVLLLAAGVAMGRYSAGSPVVPGRAADSGDFILSADLPYPVFASRDEALRALERAGGLYQHASAYLLGQDFSAHTGDADLYRTRLAALDEVAAATQRALNEAPYDPVINRYYLATMGARQATLEQLGTSMPTGVRLTGF